jgi:hypothetical protein
MGKVGDGARSRELGVLLVVAAVAAACWLGVAGARATCFRPAPGGRCQVVKPETDHLLVTYAGLGTQTSDGRYSFLGQQDCVINDTATASYSFEQRWNVRATIKGGKLSSVKVAFLGAGYPPSFGLDDNKAFIKGSKTKADPSGSCADSGTFDCRASDAAPQRSHDLALRPMGARVLLEAGGVFGHNIKGIPFTGTNNVPSDHGCQGFDDTFDRFWGPPLEATVAQVPVRLQTLEGLARGHQFVVRTSPGHYAPKARTNCSNDSTSTCTVTDSAFQGKLTVRRVS